MVVLRDQSYPIEAGSLEFDFFRPNGSGPYPLVVFLHGGGWISGDKTMYRDEALWLVPQGYACACIDYRLAPLYPFPAPVADCQAFVRYVRENAESLAIDPNKITAMGNSAGGHLALMLALCPMRMDAFDGPAERVNAVVDVCGITDLTNPTDAHYQISMSFLEQFMDGPYEGNEDKWRSASPMNYLAHAQGKFLVIHGTDDDVVPVSQSHRLVQGLTGRGLDVKYVELEGEMHSFTMQGWQQIQQELVAFLPTV
jgi:acetyl esterase/lipase